MSRQCARCARSLELVSADEIAQERISTGFGHANERINRYCSVRCQAVDNDRDPVLETTLQATLAAFDSEQRSISDRIAYSV